MALVEAKPAEDPHWIDYFDAAELAGTTGGRLLKLARKDRRLANEAVGRIEQAIAVRRPGRLRSSALDQIGLVEARLIQCELDEAPPAHLCRRGLRLLVAEALRQGRIDQATTEALELWYEDAHALMASYRHGQDDPQ